MGVLIKRAVKNKIAAIFEHPGEVYSIYMKDESPVVWVEGKVELYECLRLL